MPHRTRVVDVILDFSWCCCPGAMWPCHSALFRGSRQWVGSNRPCPSHWRMSSLTVRRTTQRSELPLSLACRTISSLSQSVADAEAGFCTPPLTWSQLLRETQGKPIRLIPRCVIQQSSGKQRIISITPPHRRSVCLQLGIQQAGPLLCFAAGPACFIGCLRPRL